MDAARLQEEMDLAVSQGVFPGGVLLTAIGPETVNVVCAGRIETGKQSRPVTPETIYDLASLTKILSTTILAMIFLEEGRFSLDTSLVSLWPGRVPQDKKGLTLVQLLGHTSGLPAWRPYYQDLAGVPAGKRRARAAELILKEPLESKPGRREIYSDLNFILLGLILEEIGQARQDVLFNRLIAGPLDLKTIGYRPLDRYPLPLPENLAPTEEVPRRGGLLRGEVHDDNAAALAGVAGHAGLFGLVREVWLIFSSLRAAHRDEPGPRLVSPETVRAFWRKPKTSPHRARALGFDTPSPAGSSAGRFFSPSSVGHLGFTGVSLWHDPDKDLTIILLTNRVHPAASNEAIKEFRPYIHDIVAETLAPRT